MFYSHEILNNTQYGVSTIWLVATVGNGNQKRLTKKAIQRVNVPKACKKILDPGAPLALRLQGNLLYGISRVFAQQCAYVLTDAEKAQSDMVTFFRMIRTSEIDLRAGKTKRQNIVLEDEPGFDPSTALPNLDLLRWDKDILFVQSQGSASKFSHMTPLTAASQGSTPPRHRSALVNLELPPSSQSAASCRIPSDFGNLSPLFGKSIHHPDDMAEFQPFSGDEFPSISGIGLGFDAEGNLISFFDQEPELPPLPAQTNTAVDNIGMQQTAKQDQGIILGEEEALVPDFGDQPPQGADMALTNDGMGKPMEAQPQAAETKEAETNQAENKTAKSRRVNSNPPAPLDGEITITNGEIRSWALNYVAHVASTRKQQQQTTTTHAQAKKNAMALLYKYGVARVGAYQQTTGLVHPLAADFAGISLKAHLQGREPGDIEEPEPRRRGRRRKSDEAFGDEHDGHLEPRNTRPRITEDDVELGRGGNRHNHDDAHVMFDDHSVPEIGMHAAQPMEDRHSSSLMPWSRAGSAVPGSSVRGSAQKSKMAPSPLFSRGGALGAIDRHSDPAEPLFGMDDLGSQDPSFQLGGPVGPLDFDPDGNAIQFSAEGLNAAGQDFLGYVAEQAAKTGVIHARDPKKRRWIEFEELAEPGTHSKVVAAQAFLHVLALASKKVISVHQEGAAAMKPFGSIRIGVDASADEAYEEAQTDSEDELA
ncbi:meiotic recombination rec8 [Trichoderma cornu-damae]|uniref:Meiotic recombination rec8 n=1 Tax=Trichoderma cornu-damae TaxID=654480 RepID=A0A9P8QL71_9HYPO|nr:meiotic recombination rec8 [Trichoderma cornu-damae]